MQTFITSLTLTSKRTLVTDLSTMRLQSQWLSSNEIRKSWVWGRWTREENNWDVGLTRFKGRWMHWCWKWTMRWKWWRPIFSDSEVEFGHGQCCRTFLSGVSSRSMFQIRQTVWRGARYAVHNRQCHLDAQEQMELRRCSSDHRKIFVCPCQVGGERIRGWGTHEHRFHTYHTIRYPAVSSQISLWLPAWPPAISSCAGFP